MEKIDFLKSLAQKADEIMLKYYQPGGQTAQIKDDLSPVTKADLEINQFVIDEMKNYFSDHGVLGEEQSYNENNEKLLVVDPLDGTKMFVIGSPLFAFSAAFVEAGQPVAGILHNPLAKRTIVAEKNKGAYLVQSRESVRVSDTETYEEALVETGWSQSFVSTQIHKAGGRTPTVYAICESSAVLATGGYDAIVFTGRKPWDMAAAKIVVEEAGGMVTNLKGSEQRYNTGIEGALLSNGKLHDKLLKTIRESGLIEAWEKWV